MFGRRQKWHGGALIEHKLSVGGKGTVEERDDDVSGWAWAMAGHAVNDGWFAMDGSEGAGKPQFLQRCFGFEHGLAWAFVKVREARASGGSDLVLMIVLTRKVALRRQGEWKALMVVAGKGGNGGNLRTHNHPRRVLRPAVVMGSLSYCPASLDPTAALLVATSPAAAAPLLPSSRNHESRIAVVEFTKPQPAAATRTCHSHVAGVRPHLSAPQAPSRGSSLQHRSAQPCSFTAVVSPPSSAATSLTSLRCFLPASRPQSATKNRKENRK
ncbi:hypothetical protein M0R45_019695 [Rubus argutus]|uniref:Uncharacterized protein n=1 Tax=Rubus argutus TaxID=59490 RepID=A0AAW1X706_RUBAR